MPWNGYWHMGWMSLWPIFGIALVVLLVWVLFTRIPFRPDGGGESPEQILKRRYAKGEVDRDTYERMLSDLKK